jgi:glycosyltransferase involved in cell wall biosynthesis
LYQRPQVRDDHEKQLRHLGANGEFIHFVPYFDSSTIEFSVNYGEKMNLGRISRHDADKFSRDTLHIYEYIVSPKFKQGRFLGWDNKLIDKIGKPYDWIKVYKNQHELSVKDFYNLTDIIVQPTDTTENWPRIGFEAMYSGKPLVVDNKGGWQYMIDHGVNGFLCNSPRDFIYWGSRLCYEPQLRDKIAKNALEKAKQLSSFEVSRDSWASVFEKAFN